MKKILILHGPNINLTGIREPDTYGRVTLEDINREIQECAAQLGVSCDIFQSNHEGVLVDRIHQAPYSEFLFHPDKYVPFQYRVIRLCFSTLYFFHSRKLPVRKLVRRF